MEVDYSINVLRQKIRQLDREIKRATELKTMFINLLNRKTKENRNGK